MRNFWHVRPPNWVLWLVVCLVLILLVFGCTNVSVGSPDLLKQSRDSGENVHEADDIAGTLGEPDNEPRPDGQADTGQSEDGGLKVFRWQK